MFSVLQTVGLADRCFLCELLYWAALRRFPLAVDDPQGGRDDFRFSRERDLDTRSFVESVVTFAECEYSGLPPNPRYRALEERGYELDEEDVKSEKEYYDRCLSMGREEISAADLEAIRDEQRKLLAELKEMESWDKEFEHYLEYIKTKVFLDLREGAISGFGIKLKGSSWQEICDSFAHDDIPFGSEDHSSIGQTEWIPSKIDWNKSILYGKDLSYGWVNFQVEKMFSVYPILGRLPKDSRRRPTRIPSSHFATPNKSPESGSSRGAAAGPGEFGVFSWKNDSPCRYFLARHARGFWRWRMVRLKARQE